ncbi:MAG: hypothetical protein ABI861_07870, partial [Panacibacter sp.]
MLRFIGAFFFLQIEKIINPPIGLITLPFTTINEHWAKSPIQKKIKNLFLRANILLQALRN